MCCKTLRVRQGTKVEVQSNKKALSRRDISGANITHYATLCSKRDLSQRIHIIYNILYLLHILYMLYIILYMLHIIYYILYIIYYILYIQDVSKVLGQTPEVCPHTKTRKKFHISICP
jgi:hypothetical protein